MKSMNKSTDSTNYKCQNQSASITRYTSRFPVDFHGWCLKPVFLQFSLPKSTTQNSCVFRSPFPGRQLSKKGDEDIKSCQGATGPSWMAPTQRNGRWDEAILESADFFKVIQYEKLLVCLQVFIYLNTPIWGNDLTWLNHFKLLTFSCHMAQVPQTHMGLTHNFILWPWTSLIVRRWFHLFRRSRKDWVGWVFYKL